jgi:ppGpp synthetase/RelA/SpoT-type nucleotidyltranferase
LIKALVDARTEGENFAKTATEALIQQLCNNPYFGINKEHSIGWRIKSAEAIEAKARHLEKTRPERIEINDFIGIRVLVGHLWCVEEVKLEIKKWAQQFGLIIIQYKDRFENPDVTGYRAIHFDYCFSHPQKWKLPPEAGVELQLTTWLQYLHSMISHQLYYKNVHSSDKQMKELLCSLSTDIHEIDRKLLEIFSLYKNK